MGRAQDASTLDDLGGDAGDAAALELTLLSLDGVKNNPEEAKLCYVVAWLDPASKQRACVSGRRQRLYFPLSGGILEDASSSITIEVLCRSRLPLQPPRTVGFALLPIACVRVAAEPAADPLSLPLRRPSGRARGSLLVAARILWDLGCGGGGGRFSPVEASFSDSGLSLPLSETDDEVVQPTAPPLPESAHTCDQNSALMTLVGGAVLAAVAFLGGVAFGRLKN